MIKYRVWDNTEQKYDYDGYSIGCDGKLYKSGGVVELAKDYIIEQYTGLKDKNGEKIYKGDILYCVNISFNGVYTDSMVVEEGCACNFSHFGEIEIIGNIHENAELLEEYKSGE